MTDGSTAPQNQAPQNDTQQGTAAPNGGATPGQSSGAGPRGELARGSAFPLLAMSSPFALMRQMSDEMDRLFADVLAGSFGRNPSLAPRLLSGVAGSAQGLWAPQLEVLERDGQMVVRADLPGLSKEDVRVRVENGALVLEGERRQQHEAQQGGFYRSERAYGLFRRVVALPEGANADEVKGSFKEGVLEVTVPLPQAQQGNARQIELE